ncbi:universal stress protein [Mesonia sediminis]|uniref:Universal stress protein n=1 Tax=Mesonia sediminis TaxID=1703946 RepID=A0ABW5SDS1_9FLAO
MNILIPTDFSENSWNAIQYSLAFFKEVNVVFHIVHVESSTQEEESLEFSGNIAIDKKISVGEDKLKQLKEKIAKNFPLQSEQINFHIETGFLIETLRQIVNQLKITYIVMGTKGVSNNEKCLIGTNTADVIKRIQCPILVVPEKTKYKKPKQIVFPTDFSNFSKERVFRNLAEILHLNHSALSVLYVAKKNDSLTAFQSSNKARLKEYIRYLPHSFQFTVKNSLCKALQEFINLEDIQMIALPAKNVYLFQNLLFQPVEKNITYPKEIPFLVLHE